jgi:hypothetical protein
MKLFLDWSNPIPLLDGSDRNLMYRIDPERLPNSAGVYVFGRRRRNRDFEALYVGKANNISGRVRSHEKNLPLMMHLKNARNGKLFVRVGVFNARQGQTAGRCLPIIERALIRYFLSEGHDLVNKQGTRLRRHEIASDNKHPNLFIPKLMFVDKARGE